MTDEQWIDYVYSLLGESQSSYKLWSPTELALYKQVGIITACSEFWNLLAVTHKKPVLCDMTADDPYITPMSGEDPISYHKPIRVEYATTGRKLDYIEDNELWKYETGGTGIPQVWIFDGGKIRQVPTPNSTSANYWRFWYLPVFTTLAELPQILHPLIAIDAIIDSRIKDERLMKALLFKRERLASIAMKELAVAQLQEPARFGLETEDSEDV